MVWLLENKVWSQFYINTNSFKVHAKVKYIDADLVEDDEERFYTSSYETERPLPIIIS